MSKPDTLKLQVACQVVPGSKEERVLTYLLDRSRTTSSQARQRVMTALVAWLDVECVRSARERFSSQDYEDALLESLAALKGRVAYLEALLARQSHRESEREVLTREQTETVAPPVSRSSAAVERETGGEMPRPIRRLSVEGAGDTAAATNFDKLF